MPSLLESELVREIEDFCAFQKVSPRVQQGVFLACNVQQICTMPIIDLGVLKHQDFFPIFCSSDDSSRSRDQ